MKKREAEETPPNVRSSRMGHINKKRGAIGGSYIYRKSRRIRQLNILDC